MSLTVRNGCLVDAMAASTKRMAAPMDDVGCDSCTILWLTCSVALYIYYDITRYRGQKRLHLCSIFNAHVYAIRFIAGDSERRMRRAASVS